MDEVSVSIYLSRPSADGTKIIGALELIIHSYTHSNSLKITHTLTLNHVPGTHANALTHSQHRTIFSETGTRNLFLFLLLNLSFAFVELFWGMWTNSLGLISDSFHMFFDCTALLAGLIATVVAKWAANETFSYGCVGLLL